MMHECQRPNTPEEEIWLALQTSEDTCAKHGVFLCPECFPDTEITTEDDT